MQKKKISILTILLLPFSLLYRLVIVIRNLMFDWNILQTTEFKMPVISVGNLTVGGTGKTPHIEYLIRLLEDEYKLATLSRGYKRKTKYFTIADNESTVADIGDEPRQLKQKFPNLLVAVDRKRVNGINQLMKLKDNIDVILLDDAFQHRYVKPGKSILLIDYNRMITEDFMLPAGRLREPVSSKSRADIILITKSPEKLKPIEMRNIANAINLDLHQHLFFTNIEYRNFLPVYNLENKENVEAFKGNNTTVVLLTGIADPRPLRKYARSISTNLHEINFPDHHQFTEKDLAKVETLLTSETIQNIPVAKAQDFSDTSLNSSDAEKTPVHGSNKKKTLILTTEKDAMRLQALNPSEEFKKLFYYISIEVKFLNNDKEKFNQNINNYVRSNKRNNILYQEQNEA